MDIRLETQDVALPPRAGQALNSRVAETFARLSSGIARLHLTLKDINGPRGGRGKVCVLRAELAGGGHVVVTDRSARLGRAIVRCMRRGRARIAMELRRRRLQPRRTARRINQSMPA
jgi:hypothetical protein